ncbi:MAG: ATP-binding protein [Lentisphaeria bacterium]|nr:ATP-binding protein [Lentisphaeria bacterium]
MERYAMSKLLAWKNSPHRKPLLLLGARQVGKTWLLNDFGNRHFKKVANIRFDRNSVMRETFSRDYDIPRLLSALQLEAGFKITPEDTLIIFDEIQTCPAALTSLKYFCEDAPEYAIAAAGSLLGVAEHQGTGFPVGKVNRIYLYPMTFTEFLTATGHGQFAELIAADDWDMLGTFHEKLSDLLKYYYFIGGMPEAVASYVEFHDFQQVRRIQQQLLSDYSDDFEKHVSKSTAAKIRMIWESIPNQLAKENKKFVYSDVKKSLRSRDLEEAMQWLLAAGMIYHIHNVSKPAFPLNAYREENAFKAFFLDIGLLAAKSNLNARTILEGNAVFQEFKGALAEQYVLQQIVAESGSVPYYWSEKSPTREVDFVIEHEENIIPLEVKAERNLQAKSLKFYCRKYHPAKAVRTSMSKFFRQTIVDPGGKQDGYTLIDLPLFAVSRLASECEK